MHYTLKNGDKYTLPGQNTVGILSSIGASVIDESPSGTGTHFKVDLSGVEGMNRTDLHSYVDPFRRPGEMSCRELGTGLGVEIAMNHGKQEDFRNIAAVVAGQAIERGDALGQAFEAKVIELAERNPNATFQPAGSPIRQSVTSKVHPGFQPMT